MDDYDGYDDGQQGGQEVPKGPKDLRDAYDRAKAEATTLQAQNAALARKVAMAEAGIPLTDPKVKYLEAVKDATPEALRLAAEELGILQASPRAETQTVPAAEVAALQAIDATGQGGLVPPPVDVNTLIANTKSEAELFSVLSQHAPHLMPSQ